MKEFIKYLESTLPKNYNYVVKEDSVMILDGSEYVYLFHRQELEDNFRECCEMVEFILDMGGL